MLYFLREGFRDTEQIYSLTIGLLLFFFIKIFHKFINYKIEPTDDDGDGIDSTELEDLLCSLELMESERNYSYFYLFFK